jgi:aspartate/methionine/tyrosine aminotransferase
MLSKRAQQMDFSGIRKVFDLGSKLADPINLSIGQPDFDVADELKAVATEAIRGGRNSYAPTAGLPELRAALRTALERRYQLEPEDVLVTAGVSGGLALAMLALLDPGDEVLVPDPYFVSYKQLAHLAGAKPVFYDTYPHWRPNVQEMESLVTPRTRMLLVNSPANPTGAVLREDDLRQLADFAAAHDLTVISDEIYDDFFFDGEATPSFARLHPRTVVLNGFSKSQAMTGWRVGWAAGPEEIIGAMAKIQQFTFVTVPPPFQLAAVRALSSGTDLAAGHLDEYRTRRDLMYELLCGSFELEKPAGAFYAFPQAPWGTAGEFIARAVENNVLAIPGSVFSERDTHFRLSFAAPEEVIREGAGVLCRLAAERPA